LTNIDDWRLHCRAPTNPATFSQGKRVRSDPSFKLRIAPLPPGKTGEPKSCPEVKEIADQQLYGLLSLQDNLTFEKATLPKFYDEYTDGLRDKAPQLIPLLRYVDSRNEFVTAWARLPLELLEMLLLVGMGALGGVIAVTRCFVDTSTPNPTARDLCYRPAP